MSAALKQFLFDQYDGFRDKRARNPNLNRPVQIDNRDGDTSSSFCDMDVTVSHHQDNTFTLEMRQAPQDEAVKGLIERNGGHWEPGVPATLINVRMNLKVSDAPLLRKLAKAIRRVTARGQTYPESNWKWVCPRTAEALENFAQNLREFRHAQVQNSNRVAS